MNEEELKALVERLTIENKELKEQCELMMNQALSSFGSKWTGRHWCPPLCNYETDEKDNLS